MSSMNQNDVLKDVLNNLNQQQNSFTDENTAAFRTLVAGRLYTQHPEGKFITLSVGENRTRNFKQVEGLPFTWTPGEKALITFQSYNEKGRALREHRFELEVDGTVKYQQWNSEKKVFEYVPAGTYETEELPLASAEVTYNITFNGKTVPKVVVESHPSYKVSDELTVVSPQFRGLLKLNLQLPLPTQVSYIVYGVQHGTIRTARFAYLRALAGLAKAKDSTEKQMKAVEIRPLNPECQLLRLEKMATIQETRHFWFPAVGSTVVKKQEVVPVVDGDEIIEF